MYFKQILTPGLGCYSYVIGCPGAKVCAVVDPKRDIQDYLDISREENMRITHIIDTHLHADHVSGGQELSARTGAPIYLYDGTPVTYGHESLTEGDMLTLGAARLEVLATPGHTPHALSLLVTDTLRSQEPWMILTGDLLFVGDIGRPDLAGAEVLDEQVNNLYTSLYEKLGKLPDSLEVFPAHGQGSLCGKGMSSKGNSTLGFERKANPALAYTSKQDFVKAMKGEFPTRPRSFTHIIGTNAAGAPLLECCPLDLARPPHEFKSMMDDGALVIDTRDTAAFGGFHIPGSMNIGLEKQTANWVGMVVKPDADMLLVVDDQQSYEAMRLELMRIGYDRLLGYLDGGISAWVWQGMPLERLSQISVTELKEQLGQGGATLLDVRTPTEWHSGRIKEARSETLTDILDGSLDAEPRDKPYLVICGSGYRSNIVASHMKQQGFDDVRSVAGGMFAWVNAMYPVVT